MGTITLDDRDEAVLDRLRRGDADVETLAESVTADAEYLGDRLPELADNGLVERAADAYTLTDDEFERTSVRFALERLDPGDERRAVRRAFDRLSRDREVTANELEAVYSDYPAGYDSVSKWWNDYVRPAFESLPGVDPADADGTRWRYRSADEGPMSSEPGAELPDGPLGPDGEE